MTQLERLKSRVSLRMIAGLLSAALHLGLFFLIAVTGDRYEGIHDGATPLSQMVLLESRTADPKAAVEPPVWEPRVTPTLQYEPLTARNDQPPAPPVEDVETEVDDAELTLPVEFTSVSAMMAEPAIDSPSTFVLPQVQKSALLQHLARVAETLATTPHAQVTWQQDGRQYHAALVLNRANDGVEFDRAVAEVSAVDRGKHLTTRVMLKRLAFSHFTQMVDRWDPMVQLHDDEIVGRLHINSRFNLMDDGRVAPKFRGKVTTAARSFTTDSSGRRRESDIFQGGIETSTGRIALPEELQPFIWAPRDAKDRIYELQADTRIRFFADGSYSWRALDSAVAEYRNEPSDQPVYFIAKRGAAIYVQGIVAGKILVYSPKKIVVEGSLTYAHDPRQVTDSRDYLGLVCDGNVEVAPAYVTGPGDLDIHAAIFAGRRFNVTDIDRRRSATLRIYGSLVAASLSASEPRYATKVEYDNRFEEQRPPGFPSTNRFTTEAWDGQWTEPAEQEVLSTAR